MPQCDLGRIEINGIKNVGERYYNNCYIHI